MGTALGLVRPALWHRDSVPLGMNYLENIEMFSVGLEILGIFNSFGLFFMLLKKLKENLKRIMY